MNRSNAELAIRLEAFAESLHSLILDCQLVGDDGLVEFFETAAVAYAATALGITASPNQSN